MLSLKHDNGIIVALQVWYSQWLVLHQILAGNVTHAGNLHAWNHYYTVNAVSSSGVAVRLKEIFLPGLDLTVTDINTKKYRTRK